MKKLFLSLSVILVFVAYALFNFLRSSKDQNQNLAGFGLDDSISEPGSEAVPGLYKDGTYKGSVSDVYYGNVEVEILVKNGRLVDLAFLQYPNTRGNSMKISSQAMPILKSEAIKAQDANVDIVSGATQTSKGFIKSLSDALAQARK